MFSGFSSIEYVCAAVSLSFSFSHVFPLNEKANEG